jgi:hypothetical protein
MIAILDLSYSRIEYHSSEEEFGQSLQLVDIL